MKKCLVWLFVSVVFAGMAHAQGQAGQIFGGVTDPSGAAMPGVTVTAAGPAVLQPLVAVTSATGTYQFPGIPIGVYSVKFEASGYRTTVQQNIRVEIGFNAQINAQLEIATLGQTVEVVETSPVVDTQSTTQAALLDEERLQSLPSGRGQYNLVEQSAGIAGATKDIGGATNGQQTGFMSRGGDPNQTKFYMEGVDLAPAGAYNAYFMDVDSIKEMAITTGGADASVQSSGLTVNMVSKSGGDQFHGSVHEDIEDQRLEATNLTPAMRQQTLVSTSSPGNLLQHLSDWGGEVGGPVKKGRVWFWGDYGQQIVTLGNDKVFNASASCQAIAANPIAASYRDLRACTHSDPVILKHFAYKIGVQLFHNNTFTFTNRYDVKEQQHFQYSVLRAEASSQVLASPYDSLSRGPRFWDAGWPTLWKFGDQQIINDRWILDLGFLHFVKNNRQDVQTPALQGVQPEYEQSTGQYDRSYLYSLAYQPMNSAQVASTYFLPGKWGGDHSIKVGYQYTRYENYETQNYGGEAMAIFNSAAGLPAFSTPLAVNFYRPGIFDAFLYQQNGYIQDSYKHKRITLNLGIRWDRQNDMEKPVNVPASIYQGQTAMNGTAFNFLPAVQFPGGKGGVVWNTFAPRLGVTYDLFGHGKTVLRASYDRYFDQRFSGQLSDTYDTIGTATNNQGVTQSFVQFPWTDLNHDGVVQMNEVNTGTIRSFGGQYNPANPTQTVSPNSVDPHIKDPQTDEFMAGVSQELASDFAVSVTYIRRKYTNIIWHQLNGISSANYSAQTYTPAANACPAGAQCSPVTYFVPNITVPAAYTLANEPDYYRRYQGLEVTVRKRFAQRWMMNASYTYQSTLVFYTAPDAYQDPTNIAQQSGAQYAPALGGYNIPISTNARWIARIGGTYRFKWQDIGLSAIFDGRQGYPMLNTITVSSRPNSAGSVAVLLQPPGTERLPNFYNLDLRIAKAFRFEKRGRVVTAEPAFDIYNLFNSNMILVQQPNQNGSSANLPGAVQGPRVARIAVRVTF